MSTSIVRTTVSSNFTKVPNSLINHTALTPYEKLIVIYILSFEECFASQKKMGTELKMSRSSVQRAISNLFKMNVIRKVPRERWSCVYVVNPSAKWELDEA